VGTAQLTLVDHRESRAAAADTMALTMRRIGARITQARDESTLLGALHEGVQELAGDCTVRLHAGNDDATTPVGGTVVPLHAYGTKHVAALILGDERRLATGTLVAAAGVLAALAAATIGQLRLQQALMQRSMQLSGLNDLSRRLNSCETTQQAVEIAAEGSAELCGAGQLGLYQVREGLLTLTGYVGDVADFPATVRVLDSQGQVLLGGGRGRAVPLGESRLDGGSIVLLVLRAGDRMEGVLIMRGSAAQDWEDTALVLAEGLAEHLAVALRHIDLLERSRHQAAYDDLTGLASRRQFMHELARETERVRRQGSPLSLAMVDADHFKKVNDTYGHAAGDEVLKALAACLRKGTRSLDVVGRLGGEELGVLLPGASEETATMVSERLRQSIEDLVVEHKDTRVQITVSIGIAEWDAEMTYEDLLESADAALYRAKAEGRNRVVSGGSLETVLHSVAPEGG